MITYRTELRLPARDDAAARLEDIYDDNHVGFEEYMSARFWADTHESNFEYDSKKHEYVDDIVQAMWVVYSDAFAFGYNQGFDSGFKGGFEHGVYTGVCD